MLGLVILTLGAWIAMVKLNAYVRYAETVKRVEALNAISMVADETETASSEQVSTEGPQQASARPDPEVTAFDEYP
jgi:hypothetical protein